MHFQIVIWEFDIHIPLIVYKQNPAQINGLYQIYESIYEEIKNKSITWGGEIDEGIANMIRTSLKEHGFKEKISTPLIKYTKDGTGAGINEI